MDIKSVLDERVIDLNMTAKNKKEAIEHLAGKLKDAGYIADVDSYIEDIYLRESQGQTGIGHYVAIPHGKSVAVKKPGVAVSVLDHEIEWESLDNTGAKIVILFAVGADDEAAMEHLKLLAMFSKRLGDDAVIKRLLDADSVEDVIHAFAEEEAQTEDLEEEELDLDDIEIL